MRSREKNDQCKLEAALQDDRTFGTFIDPVRTVAFTGHRSYKIYASARGENRQRVQQIVIARTERAVRLLCAQGYDTFLCGMAMGFDLWAAWAVLSVKPDFSGVRLIAVMPFRGQEAKYPDADKRLYYEIMDEVDHSICLYDRYTSNRDYIDRNRAMLDHATMLVCYFNGESGGTASTVFDARNREMQILNICGHRAARRYNHNVDDRLITEIMKIR